MSPKRDTSYLRVPLVTGLIAAVLFMVASTGPVSSAQSFSPPQKARVTENYGNFRSVLRPTEGRRTRA